MECLRSAAHSYSVYRGNRGPPLHGTIFNSRGLGVKHQSRPSGTVLNRPVMRFLTRSFMKFFSVLFLFFVLIAANLQAFDQAGKDTNQSPNNDQTLNTAITGFRDVAGERVIEKKFIAVPDPKLAEEHLRILTQAPHIAGSPEDKATAEYVAKKFREAGLDTEIVEYNVWLNYPTEISVDMTAPAGVEMHGPRREQVDGDPFQ